MCTPAASWRIGTSLTPWASRCTSSGSASGEGSPNRNSMPSACSARANSSPPVISAMVGSFVPGASMQRHTPNAPFQIWRGATSPTTYGTVVYVLAGRDAVRKAKLITRGRREAMTTLTAEHTAAHSDDSRAIAELEEIVDRQRAEFLKNPSPALEERQALLGTLAQMILG